MIVGKNGAMEILVDQDVRGGQRNKAIHGAENVFDFSLGNPDVPPPRRC